MAILHVLWQRLRPEQFWRQPVLESIVIQDGSQSRKDGTKSIEQPTDIAHEVENTVVEASVLL